MLLASDYFAIGLNVWSTAMRLGETLAATQSVLASRSRTLDTAIRNPMETDFAELGRFVPEKMDAFSRAGLAWTMQFWRLQADAFAQMQDLGAIAMAGARPKPRVVKRVIRRSGKLATEASVSAGRALAPVHKTVTANQKRLKRSNAKR